MKEMKLSIKATFSESQKAQIVARGDQIGSIYTFEMTAKYAAVFPKLDGDYHVSDEGINMAGHAIKVNEYRNEAGKWIGNFMLDYAFPIWIAKGTLKDGASCDPVMQKIEKLLDAKEAANQATQEKAEEDAARQERERPAREAQEARDAEEKRIARETRDAEEAERKAARQAEIETAKAEKLAWIEAQGSERLQKGIAAGYHCQKIYTTERGKIELGSDYILDYDGKIATKDRSCPSLEALNEAERLTGAGITARVKWLPNGTETADEDGYWDCEPSGCEAVEAKLLGLRFYLETA